MIVRKKANSSSLDYFNVVTNTQGDVYKILGGFVGNKKAEPHYVIHSYNRP